MKLPILILFSLLFFIISCKNSDSQELIYVECLENTRSLNMGNNCVDFLQNGENQIKVYLNFSEVCLDKNKNLKKFVHSISQLENSLEKNHKLQKEQIENRLLDLLDIKNILQKKQNLEIQYSNLKYKTNISQCITSNKSNKNVRLLEQNDIENEKNLNNNNIQQQEQEKENNEVKTEESGDDNDDSTTTIMIIILVVIALLLIAVILVCRKYRNLKSSNKLPQEKLENEQDHLDNQSHNLVLEKNPQAINSPKDQDNIIISTENQFSNNKSQENIRNKIQKIQVNEENKHLETSVDQKFFAIDDEEQDDNIDQEDLQQEKNNVNDSEYYETSNHYSNVFNLEGESDRPPSSQRKRRFNRNVFGNMATSGNIGTKSPQGSQQTVDISQSLQK